MAFFDRRQGDRRSGGDGRDGGERRAGDRRRWSCGILFQTSLPTTEIERWLNRNAEGEWAVALDGIDESLYAKRLKIMFELPEDKAEFMAHFRGK